MSHPLSAWGELRRDSGQTTSEYAVVLTILTLGVLATLALLAGSIEDTMQNVIGYL
jgi:Flp pilus assembly pilin Flp